MSADTVNTTAALSIGNKFVHTILLSPVVVTKDNIKQTVIKDSFQNLETIQKSLPKEKWPSRLESAPRVAGYFRPQNVASGFISSKPASHASWLRHTTSASALRPVSG
jgi:hypothetical protein